MLFKSHYQKKVVLDTSVILYDTMAIKSFHKTDIYIPLPVIQEIDTFKRDMGEKGRNARHFSRFMDTLRNQGALTQGVFLEACQSYVYVNMLSDYESHLAPILDNKKVDNQILGMALFIQQYFPEASVELISKDINLRIKSDVFGIKSKNYDPDKVASVEDMYSGVRKLNLSKEQLESFFKLGYLEVPKEKLLANQYVIMEVNPQENSNMPTAHSKDNSQENSNTPTTHSQDNSQENSNTPTTHSQDNSQENSNTPTAHSKDNSQENSSMQTAHSQDNSQENSNTPTTHSQDNSQENSNTPTAHSKDNSQENSSMPTAISQSKTENSSLSLDSKANESQIGLGRYDEKTSRIVPLVANKTPIWRLHPRNYEQSFAFDALLNPDLHFVSLLGKAGTGKTLLALAAGLYKTMDENLYKRMLVCRPVYPMGKDIGYLPGDIEQKLNPWMQPVFDSLDYIMHLGKKTSRLSRDLVDQGLLSIEPLAYIRGRSIPHQYLIVDEAQNLTPHEIKTIITRAGTGTKVVLTGDCYQIDNPYIDASNSGLTYSIEKFKGQDIFAHITLTKGERSKLAELAANLL